jgi:hypothetical protein
VLTALGLRSAKMPNSFVLRFESNVVRGAGARRQEPQRPNGASSTHNLDHKFLIPAVSEKPKR